MADSKTSQQTAVEAESDQDSQDLGRVMSFTDGVFGFSLTLLVIGIKTPQGGPPDQLVAALESPALLSSFLTYLLTFFVVGSYWYTHHRIFRHIKRYDSRLVLLNLVLLLFVTLMPVSTALSGSYSNAPIAVAISSANICLVGLSFWIMWLFASTDHRLIERNLDSRVLHAISRRLLYLPIGFALSIPLTFYLPLLSSIVRVVSIFMTFAVRWHLPRWTRTLRPETHQ